MVGGATERMGEAGGGWSQHCCQPALGARRAPSRAAGHAAGAPAAAAAPLAAAPLAFALPVTVALPAGGCACTGGGGQWRRQVAAAGGARRRAAGGGVLPLSLGAAPASGCFFFFFSSPTAAPLRLHSVRPVWPLPVVAHAGTSRRPRGCLSLPQSAAPPAHRPGGGRHSVRGGLGDTREESPPAAVSPWGGAPQKGRLPRRQRRRHGPGRRSRPAAERDARHVTGALPTRAARGSRWGASAGQRPAVTVCCRHRPPPPPPQPPRRAHPTVTATRRPPPHRRGW